MRDTRIDVNPARIAGAKHSGLVDRNGDDLLGITVKTTGSDSLINDDNQLVLPSGGGAPPPLANFRQIWGGAQDSNERGQEIDQWGFADSDSSYPYIRHVYYVTWCFSWDIENERTYYDATSISGIFEIAFGDSRTYPFSTLTEFPPGFTTVVSHTWGTPRINQSGCQWFDPPLSLLPTPDFPNIWIHVRPGDALVSWHWGMWVD